MTDYGTTVICYLLLVSGLRGRFRLRILACDVSFDPEPTAEGLSRAEADPT